MRLGSSQIDYIVPAVKKEINPCITIQPVTQANSKLPLRLGNTKNGRREGARVSEEICTRNGKWAPLRDGGESAMICSELDYE